MPTTFETARYVVFVDEKGFLGDGGIFFPKATQAKEYTSLGCARGDVHRHSVGNPRYYKRRATITDTEIDQ